MAGFQHVTSFGPGTLLWFFSSTVPEFKERSGTPPDCCFIIPAMPVPKSVSKPYLFLSLEDVKIVILNPWNEAPIPIWVTLGLRDIAVFTFPFLTSNCNPARWYVPSTWTRAGEKSKQGRWKRKQGRWKRKKKRNCSDELRRGKILAKRNGGNKVSRSGFNVCCSNCHIRSMFFSSKAFRSQSKYFPSFCFLIYDWNAASFIKSELASECRGNQDSRFNAKEFSLSY